MSSKRKRSSSVDVQEYETVTLSLPKDAVKDILEKEAEGAKWTSVRDIVASVKRTQAPVTVRSTAVEHFTITIECHYDEYVERRAYYVNNHTTLYDLAQAIEKTQKVPLGDQLVGPHTPGNVDESVKTMQLVSNRTTIKAPSVLNDVIQLDIQQGSVLELQNLGLNEYV